MRQLTRKIAAYAKSTESSLKSLKRKIGQLAEVVSILAEQQAMESRSQPIAAPLDTVEAMSFAVEDEEVDDEETEETPLQELKPLAQLADCASILLYEPLPITTVVQQLSGKTSSCSSSSSNVL